MVVLKEGGELTIINKPRNAKKRTFTFKYDPTISLEGTFARMNETLKTQKNYLQKDCTIVNSIEAIYRSMSKGRLELFKCLVDKHPTSLYQLAQLLHRDYAAVWRDAKVLAGTGIIELKEEKEKIHPIPLYERIILDFSLVKDKNVETTSRPLTHAK